MKNFVENVLLAILSFLVFRMVPGMVVKYLLMLYAIISTLMHVLLRAIG